MTRYFFHVVDGIEILDRKGTEFPDLESARLHALAKADDLLNSAAPLSTEHGAQVLVTDEQGVALLSVEISPAEVRDARAKAD